MEFQQDMSLCPTGRGFNEEASALFRLMECTWRYGRNAEHLDVRRIAQLCQTMKGERKCLKKTKKHSHIRPVGQPSVVVVFQFLILRLATFVHQTCDIFDMSACL